MVDEKYIITHLINIVQDIIAHVMM